MKAIRTTLVLCVSTAVLIPQISAAQETRAQKRRELNQARRAARSLSLLAANGGGKLLRDDIERLASPALRPWIKQNKEALVGAGPNPFPTMRWGIATTNGSKLFLHVTAWPKNGKLAVPRLHNSVAAVRFTGRDEALKLTPHVKNWEISLPERPARNTFVPVIELDLDRPVQLGRNRPPVVRPGDDGTLRIHARYSVTHGQMLRFEPQAHKNTVGYWVEESDWVEWALDPNEKTKYDIVLRYGCGDGQGGSEIELKLGESSFPYVVEATGGFQAWREVTVGMVDGLEGPTSLTVKVQKKAKNAVMDIQEIRLEPR